MKKNLARPIPVVIAITAASFAAPSKKTLTYVEFVGNPASVTQVQDETSWEEISPAPNCNGVNKKACRIQIDHSKLTIHPMGTIFPRVLNGALLQINAAHGISINYYIVSSLTGNPGAYVVTNQD
ncbi:hypothetical protein HHL16_19160 [Pseudoflavitalea sp. G-6-1-2]|uniref:hypothetical protein n=1 Tax=Pseudoflavitalea sp. G-6-1-2 TaxID=2728841 RepID=UPI00146B0C83|nr:hypothetical protein [Pseudoflavitalea sp. G-6-1-2]NML23005.1 hypothetical protein [Pseudoflavitalea sp. G-6-1-2]